MARSFRCEGGFVTLVGDTFNVRERIKKIGGRWDAGTKTWKVVHTPEAVEQVLALGFLPLESAGAPTGPASVALDPVAAVQAVQAVSESLNEKTWSVGEFVTYVGAVIARELSFGFWLSGEISSLKSSNGHVYFDLAESENEISAESTGRACAISCALWAGRLRMLTARHGELPLSEGLRVRVLVHCEFRRESARLSVIVDDIDLKFTVGDLALQRQNIVRELRRRGLYERNARATFPPLPLSIALITAAHSRAASDFVDELKGSGLAFRITLIDCNMQGESTSANVCEALRLVAQAPTGGFDCVVLTRGGGSRLDLRWFDDLEICKQIAYCALPVITAIGHFEDVSVADEVAFKAEKTPTGAARFLTQKVLDSLGEVFTRAENLARLCARRFQQERALLARIEENIAFRTRARVQRERTALSSCAQTIRLLRVSLEKTLHRGFALVKTEQGQVLRASDYLQGTGPESIAVELLDPASLTEVTLHAHVLTVRTQQTSRRST